MKVIIPANTIDTMIRKVILKNFRPLEKNILANKTNPPNTGYAANTYLFVTAGTKYSNSSSGYLYVKTTKTNAAKYNKFTNVSSF